jgi:RNA polymerase sigma-70 factor (ECF subfamily)
MDRLASGDPRALEVLFDRHGAAAFSLAYRISGSRTRAEAVVEGSFLSVWRAAGRYATGRGGARSWLLAVVRNRAIEELRRRRGGDVGAVDVDDVADGMAAPEETESEVLRRDDPRMIRAALRELPAEQRRVIELAFFAGLTHMQIAQALDLPAEIVKARMRLGMAKLAVVIDRSPDGGCRADADVRRVAPWGADAAP